MAKSQKKKKTPRVSAVEMIKRIATVEQWLIQGLNRNQILDASKEQAWGVDYRQVDRYIQKAKQGIADHTKAGGRYYFQKLFYSGDLLMRIAIQEKKYDVALAAYKELKSLCNFGVGQSGGLSDILGDVEKQDQMAIEQDSTIIVLPYNGRGPDDIPEEEKLSFEEVQRLIEDEEKEE